MATNGTTVWSGKLQPNSQTRVLLVEDNAVSARMQEAMLSHAKSQWFQVLCASTLKSALDLLSRRAFDICLLDLTLPDCQGLETLRAVLQHSPSLPVIVVTSLEDESLAVKAIREGAQDYLLKWKLKQDSLIEALNSTLARTRLGRARLVR